MANVSSSNGLEKHPKLRFKGFTEPYRIVPLGDVACEVSRTDPNSKTFLQSQLTAKCPHLLLLFCPNIRQRYLRNE